MSSDATGSNHHILRGGSAFLELMYQPLKYGQLSLLTASSYDYTQSTNCTTAAGTTR